MPGKLEFSYPKDVIEIPENSTKKIEIILKNVGDSDLLITEINQSGWKTYFRLLVRDFSLLNFKIKPNESVTKYLTIGHKNYTINEVSTNKIRIFCNDPTNIENIFNIKFKMVSEAPSQFIKIPLNTKVVSGVYRTGSGGQKILVKNGGFYESGGSNDLYVKNGGIAESGNIVYLEKGGIIKSAQILYYADKSDLQYLKNEPRQMYHIPNLQFETNTFFTVLNFIRTRIDYFIFYLVTFCSGFLANLITNSPFGKFEYSMIGIALFLTIVTPNFISFINKYRNRNYHSRSGRR